MNSSDKLYKIMTDILNWATHDSPHLNHGNGEFRQQICEIRKSVENYAIMWLLSGIKKKFGMSNVIYANHAC